MQIVEGDSELIEALVWARERFSSQGDEHAAMKINSVLHAGTEI
jgi:hypothetical protein